LGWPLWASTKEQRTFWRELLPPREQRNFWREVSSLNKTKKLLEGKFIPSIKQRVLVEK